MNYKNVGIISLIFVALATTVHAQPRPDKDWKDWFGQFHGGWSVAQGEFGEVVDDGFSMNGGATYWPEDWPVGLVLEMGYNEFDLSSSTIQGINDEIDNAGGEGMITGGWVSSLAVTASVTWSPSSSGRGFYLIGGAGVYRIEGKITETGLVFYPPVCDPWFWWCSPGGVGPGTSIGRRLAPSARNSAGTPERAGRSRSETWDPRSTSRPGSTAR